MMQDQRIQVRRAVVAVFALLSGGCVPMATQVATVSGGERYDSFTTYASYGPKGRDNVALVQLGPSNAPATGRIIDVESRAITPDGKRLGISSEPYAFDTQSDRQDPRLPNIREALYLTNAKGQRDGASWKNGDWKFILAIDTPQGRRTREFDVSLRNNFTVWWLWQAPN